MKLYEPQQNLNYEKVVPVQVSSSKLSIDSRPRVYLKSSISVLVDANETLARIYDDRDQLIIRYKAIRDEQRSEKHVFDDIVLIDKIPDGPPMEIKVQVIVYRLDGKKGGQVTSTISGNATIEID